MRITSVVAACAIVLVACSDSTEPAATSSLSFSYTGAGAPAATLFTAAGSIPLNLALTGTLGTTPWAAGAIDPASNNSFVAGVIPKTSTTWDFTSIGVGLKTVGTSPIDANCGLDSANCTGVIVFFGASANDESFQFICNLASGSVTISAISATNIAGTFSGTGSCFNSLDVETPFTVTNGAFDVAISSQLTAGAPAGGSSGR
jgi:hypothetical protein